MKNFIEITIDQPIEEFLLTLKSFYKDELNSWQSRDADTQWYTWGIYKQFEAASSAHEFLINEILNNPASAGKLICYSILPFDTDLWQKNKYWIVSKYHLVKTGNLWSFWGISANMDDILDRTEAPEIATDPGQFADAASRVLNPEYDQWYERIQIIKDSIKSGEIHKAVLSRTDSRQIKNLNWQRIINSITSESVNSFIFQLNTGIQTIISNTPELLFSLESNQLHVDSLAGTRPRGKTPGEDKTIKEDLLSSEKDKYEQNIVTNRIVENLSSICDEISYPDKAVVRKLRTLQHLYTPVSGKLKSHINLDDILLNLHPTPAMGGEPKGAALHILSQIGDLPRGTFSAPAGWFSTEKAEFAVNIRSVSIKDNIATFFAGAGIVAGSDANEEWLETKAKLEVMQRFVLEE